MAISKKEQNILKHKYYNVAIEGKKVVCPFCGYDAFDVREIQMNTPSNALFKLQYLDQVCTGLICGKCGHIEHFFNDAEKLGDPVEIKR